MNAYEAVTRAEDTQAWCAFAASFAKDYNPKQAAEHADALLVEFRKRFPALPPAGVPRDESWKKL